MTFRHLIVMFLSCVVIGAVASPAHSGALGAGSAWSATFPGSPDWAEFDLTGTTDGKCTREVTGGAARYAWQSSPSDGDPTRCYPILELDPDYFDGARASGRFWLDLDPKDIDDGRWFSLATFSLVKGTEWSRVITLNVKTDTSGPTKGKPRLLLWHVPGKGNGDQTRVKYVALPLRQWVHIEVVLEEDGDLTVSQDGEIVLRARKTDAEARVYAAHWGGYASGALHDWEVRNDDLWIGPDESPSPFPYVAPKPPDPPQVPPAAQVASAIAPAGSDAPASAGAPTSTAGGGGEATSSKPGDSLPGSAPSAGAPSGGRVLRGTAGQDLLRGGALADFAQGLGGKDRILGGRGPDHLIGGNGRDHIHGGVGNDRILGQSGPDRLVGATGRDVLIGGRGRDLLIGGVGPDVLRGGMHPDRLIGGAGRDVALPGSGMDRVRMGPGPDLVISRDRYRDRVVCGPGRDTVRADRLDIVSADCERVVRR